MAEVVLFKELGSQLTKRHLDDVGVQVLGIILDSRELPMYQRTSIPIYLTGDLSSMYVCMYVCMYVV